MGSICYIVPKYHIDDNQHFAHLPHFLARVAQLCDLYVIIERSQGPPEIRGARF